MSENKEGIDPITSSNIDLIIYHRTLHSWWEAILRGETIKDLTKDDIFNHHETAAKEMTKRKIGIDDKGKHATPLPKTLEQEITNESTSLKYIRENIDYKIDKKTKKIRQIKTEKKTLTSKQKADIKTLIKGTQSLSDIARLVGCSKSSVFYYGRKCM